MTAIEKAKGQEVDMLPATTENLLAVIDRAAKNPDIDVEKMERLLALHERVTAKHAESEFYRALADVQQEMPRIERDAKNPSTNSRYARLETLNQSAVPIYTKHGFSLSFGTADCQTANHVRITCVVSHRAGHSRTYQCDVPMDIAGAKGNQNKSLTHGFGSTLSYGRRYLTLLIFNIALVNEDDDGNQGKQPKPPGPRTATTKTREWFLEKMRDIHFELQAYGIDMAIIMPDQSLEEWPLENVPVSQKELDELRRKVEAQP